ncbi:hypothetical protein DEO72_LG10g2885 [Vigna unguiculata]|uniref:General transcription factor 3C polypeptide 1 winged-helix domain-containing protein n=1 Tax=Vigna unguiculata TaxID=3917 RepID=A0A4D6NCQ8_VIGUN|nr:hypothetical protein DEO72_LG10g2885 [Vigna unguiculata]
MDSVVNVAVEEICSGIEDGITLAALWVKLQGSPTLSSSNLHLNRTVKRAIWRNLLCIPGLRFEPQPSSSELEDAEKEEEEDANGTTFQTDVLKDYSPQMKAICDKLAKANGKISQRLKADDIVEQFDAKVNGKVG